MEERLRSCLQSSAAEFLSVAVKLSIKSSKPSLKTVIHAVKPSSDLPTSLSLALHQSIVHFTDSFQKLLEDPPSAPSPSKSPPTKRRRSSRSRPDENRSNDTDQQRRQIFDSLQVLSHIVFLCVSSPKNAFPPSDLLPAAQVLHDNLIAFESDPGLSNEIAGLCECWWREGFEGRETLITQSLPFLLSRALTLKKKVDVHRVYALREGFALFEFEDESIEDLRMLLMRCMVSPLFVKTEEGRRFVAYTLGLSLQLMKAALAVVKAQIPFGRKSVLEGFGDILFRVWKEVGGDLKGEIEDGFLQGMIDSAIHASSSSFAASLRRVFGGFISQRTTEGVEKLLFHLAEPVIFRSLQVANSNVRLNALHLLLDLFPMEDPDATKEAKDTLLDKQFYLLEKLLNDDCLDVRIVAVEGLCRVLFLFWEVIPSSVITKTITKLIEDMSHESCSEVRLSTVNGIIYLLGNPQSHGILKVLLPRLGHLMLDNVTSVRVAMVDMLLHLGDIRTFQFNKVVSLDVLLSVLAMDHIQVAEGIARLLIPSYFPSRVKPEEACDRCVTLIKRNPTAGARFCQFAVSLGASLKSVLQLVGVFVNLVWSLDKVEGNQIEGLLLAVSYLCKDLVTDSSCLASLKDLLPGEKLKCLLAVAPTPQAHSSVFDIVSLVSPDIVSGLLDDCMKLIADCSGLSGDAGRQTELRSVHKLLLSCNAFDDMVETFTRLLQKAAYRCHINFGCEIEKGSVSSLKRKKSKTSAKSSVRWKHVSRKKASSFEEDYLIAVGVAWQIKDLLISEDTCKVLLGSDIEDLFLALKVVSETTILQASCSAYLDVYPVLAYTALALRMTLQNANAHSQKKELTPSLISETILEQTMDHILGCIDKLFSAGNKPPGTVCPEVSHSKNTTTNSHRQRHRVSKTRTLKAGVDVSVGSKQGMVLNKVKMLTTILKFIVDSTEMGLASHLQGRSIKFASAYLKHAISIVSDQSTDKLQLEDTELKDIILCLKSSTSYAGKFISLVLRDITEDSCPSFEAFDLVNVLLDLFTSVEISLGSAYASRLVSALNPWIPDLVLALGPCFITKNSELESLPSTSFNHLKLHFPPWLAIWAKIELQEAGENDEDQPSETLQLPAFRKVMNTIVSLLKVNSEVLDAVGSVLLIGSGLCIEKKDFGTAFGLLHFLCVKLLGREDREWEGLQKMMASLPSFYPLIEREIDEETDEDELNKLRKARDLLQPVWMYHVYETERFSMMEEEEEEE
ncbi:PREDICTED: uncharacterized protein LOC104819266 isoform X2 [Tarenaya hassleriana]|uniref:uncharacterized protein LOC104819266 isoform X2 n=1 Tax=Tarenaya hassleriana TaxID=28532 RepID=UPI00053C731A|nr:PREDICTED: uncharacterized protein LOC104819266 isoform X2 [Tarenaya hassleriana]